MRGFSTRHARLIAVALPAVRRKYGTVRTLQLAASDLFFDLRRGTDTSLQTNIPGGPVGEAALRHEPCNPMLFAELVRRLPIHLGDATMLDYGAGKGRVLIMAVEHGFHKAIGVEVSASLCVSAHRNLSRFHSRCPTARIELVCADAATFEVPDEVEVAFLFNPFGVDVVRAVVGRVMVSVRRVPRVFHVMYLYPRFADQFLDAGFVVGHRCGADGVILSWVPSAAA